MTMIETRFINSREADGFQFVADQFAAVFTKLDHMEERLVALSQAQTDALNRLKAEINEFRTKADETVATLNAEITRLNALIAELQADDTADANMIAELQQSVSNLEAAKAANEAEVVAAIDAVTNELDQLGAQP